MTIQSTLFIFTVHFGKQITSSSLNVFTAGRCPTNLVLKPKFTLCNFLPVITFILHTVVKSDTAGHLLSQRWSVSIDGSAHCRRMEMFTHLVRDLKRIHQFKIFKKLKITSFVFIKGFKVFKKDFSLKQ